MKKQTQFNTLTTNFTDKKYSYNLYPRPTLKRDSFYSLNGEWDLSIKQKNGTLDKLGKIEVPYPIESALSKINRQINKGDILLYEKEFSLPSGFNKGKVLLHFGAVDQVCEVFVNGKLVIKHEGGYLPFSADITSALEEKNILKVCVKDDLSFDYGYGKQRVKRGGMWYTKVSGIWQTVWIESVPENHIESIKCYPTLNSVKIEVVGGKEKKTLNILETGAEYVFKGNEINIEIKKPKLWSPDSPFLYHFTLTDGIDKVSSYFALRTIETKAINGKGYIALNGEPIFLHAVLDQGYFPDGIYTPKTPEGYVFDILKMKELGFNTLRKHAKIEPELFYNLCDELGMLIMQDFVNCGKYNFIIDTALPTIGLKKGITHKASKKRKNQFESDAIKTIEFLHSHPSVCYYTIFNEGWGQYDADNIYSILKSRDTSRIFDTTSGWFLKHNSDVDSHHVYFKKIKLKAKSSRPLILSEFGGYSYKLDEHSFNPDKTYGYKHFYSKDEFETALKELYLNQIVPAIKLGLCGAVLTQLSDVEDETNGLYTYDRKVCKIDIKVMREISSEVYSAFNRTLI